MSMPETGAIVTKVAQTAQYGGASGALIFGLTPSEWSVIGVLGGLLIGAAGFLINWYYKAKNSRLFGERLTNWAPDADE